MSHLRACLVSDDDTWIAEACDALLAVGGHPEVIRWTEADRLGEPPAAILAYVARTPESKASRFQEWAARAWQPATVVLLGPVRGSSRLAERLASLRYRRVQYVVSPPPFDRTAAAIRPVLERRLWVVGSFARHLGCTDVGFVEALGLVVDGRGPVHTVREWARRCRRHRTSGIGSAADLQRLMRRVGAPSPKAILDRLRLADVLGYAAVERCHSRDRLARRFGYATGDFLGRTAKRLAGVPFGTLRGMDVEAAVSVLTSDL